MKPTSPPQTIAIVGAGFSGTLVAAHLLFRAKAPLTVHLIERERSRFARGVAYSTTEDCHLLNVPAGNMSAFPDDREHFLRWAQAREAEMLDCACVGEVTAAAYLPRRAYGDYIAQILDEAERGAAPGVGLDRRIDEVASLKVEDGAVALRLASGAQLRADRVVLALGNFRPGDPSGADGAFHRSARYHGDPWAPEVLDRLLPTESCLLVGSGLTMVDWAVTLNQAGYRGAIHVVSRRGLWPQRHKPGAPAAFGVESSGAVGAVRKGLHSVRAFIRDTGADWRPAIDALRPMTQTLWKSLGLSEQRRFLRHLRTFWDCHRHRLAPGIAARLDRMLESAQLVRHVGRIRGFRDEGGRVEVAIRPRGSDQSYVFNVDAVVNCSGSESDYRRLDSPLVKDLLVQRLIRPDPLALGLDVADSGALVDAEGAASGFLFTLGPPQKGRLWETTAVPEIRGQAARLAVELLKADHSECSEASSKLVKG
ncbi:FAD/NAD(P)-binding protein [Methylococcus capsulatus]|uniref:FAD/NAD(P)-binding protein n=1 Tax=Methylococcus capsulatus TaxID=414 RepID=UPI001C52EF19|nr:FAD/NAD(P)-binding protein [Methylococcus capsulatus]QXP90553.1 FAD/NAD(P)-binding protein [Methylococcus capsulatus]